MYSAYDQIEEETLFHEEQPEQSGGEKAPPTSLNNEIQDAYNSFASSAWGARLGGFWGTVKKQGESVYEEARKEVAVVSDEALKGFTDLKTTLVSRARSMSTGETPSTPDASTAASATTATEESKEKDAAEPAPRTSTETLKESESLVARFKFEAAKRLKEIEKAEDAADEALLKFGSNLRNFFRDAVSIAPPTDGESLDKDGKSTSSKVLFESKDAEGKRVIHTTRFDAQLHVIHCSLDSFTHDPASAEYEKWKQGDFDVEKNTAEIAKFLEQYEDLRRAMEKLVPEKVEYRVFWTRYFFLRHVIESEERRRKEVLRDATSAADEEVGWDEDSEDEPSTPKRAAFSRTATAIKTSDSSSTESDLLKPNEPRKSQDRASQADSDASYDLVSGATSRAPGSPKDEKKKSSDDSDDEWE